MKKSLKVLFGALCAYAVLLVLLFLAENGSEEASIHSLGDAVWYTLVTITTVGYGDFFPVTPAGRVLGAVFALCSLGVFTTIIGLGISLLNGQLLPRLRLSHGRKKHWYVFTTENECADVLAEKLREPDALILFPKGEGGTVSGSDVLRLEMSISDILRLRKDTDGVTAFFMDENEGDNYLAALSECGSGIEIYCMAEPSGEGVPSNVHLFQRGDCLSRGYWKRYPLLASEEKLVLIGSGDALQGLLSRALLINILEADRKIEYHVFGECDAYRAIHAPFIKAVNEEGADTLCFHTEGWEEALPLISHADRVILCADDAGENLAMARQIGRFTPCADRLHVRMDCSLPGVVTFGTVDEIFTPELVLRQENNRLAMEMNDIYNASSPTGGTPWNDLTDFLKQSNMAAADHMLVKVRYLLEQDTLTELTPALCRKAYEKYKECYSEHFAEMEEMEHRRWMRFHLFYNWEYAPIRNNARRQHPLLVPFEALSEEDRRKDDYAWEMLSKL